MRDIKRSHSALNSLDPSCPREDWVIIGMAAKSAGLLFEDFHQWSKDGGNYGGEADCRSAWNSFKEDGGITAATLFQRAIRGGWQAPSKAEHVNPKNAGRVKSQRKQNTRSGGDVQKAQQIWAECQPVLPSHAYIIRKQGIADGLRCYPDSGAPLIICGQNVSGYLVVPCLSGDEIQTLQFIPPHQGGKKLNLPASSFNEGFFTVGAVTTAIYICEGLGQAWAVYKATGSAAVVCFGAGRMMLVAKVLRKKYPKVGLVIVPDRGKEKDASKVAIAVGGEWVALPENKPINYDVSDYALEHGVHAAGSLLEFTVGREMRYKLLSGADLCNAPPMRWLVHGVLPAEGLGALYGASGTGKSFLILDLACAVASGDLTWFGHRVAKTSVAYLCLEGEAGLGKRIQAWCIQHNKSFPDSLRFITASFNLLSEDVEKLAEAIIAANAGNGLLIIDTLNRAAPGADENSPIDMGKIISSAKRLQGLIGGLVLLVHHSGKNEAKGLRGHSSLYAALDAVIEVATRSVNEREWIIQKSKDDIAGGTKHFKLNIVQVGIFEGEAITSCSVLCVDSTDRVVARTFPPKSGNQKIVWEVLSGLFLQTSYIGEGGAPAGRPCLRLDEAIEKTRSYLPCESKRRTERANKALTGLVSRGLLGHKDGWIWMC